MAILLDEYSPRPVTYTYLLHRARAVVRHQFSWMLPGLIASFYLIFSFQILHKNLNDELNFLNLFSISLCVSALMFAAGRALWSVVSARLYPILDTHPQSPAGIAAGYRMPTKPTTLAAVLGECHPSRMYTPDGSYTLKHNVNEEFSPTPEWSVLPAKSLVTGLLIVGGIGSGKTSYLLRPSIFKLFHHGEKVGGLVMDSKASLVEPLRQELAAAGREDDFLPIGPDRPTKWNPLHMPLSLPATVAAACTSTIENVRGSPYNAEAAWIKDGAGQAIEGAIGLIRMLNGYVTAMSLKYFLTSVVNVCSGEQKPGQVASDFIKTMFSGSDAPERMQDEYEYYSKLIIGLMSQDEKFRGIYVNESMTLILPLTHPSVSNTFNSPEAALDCPSWPTIIDCGLVLCLDCNNQISPNLSVILGMMLKLGYQNSMLARLDWQRKELCNGDRHMILCIDEYQEFCSPNDSSYLALCRESKSMTVFLTQGIPSIIQRVGEQAADVIIQSLRNRLFLTCQLPKQAAELLGEHEVEEIDSSITENVNDASLHASGKFAGQSSVAESMSIRRTRKHRITPEALSELPTGQGILQAHDGERAIPLHRVFMRPYFKPDTRAADLRS